jgi:DNA-binding NarL/FixJ family response regulator
MTNKEVARRLGISDRTVGHHLQHVYDKLGVSTRSAAALFAQQHGLVGPGAVPHPANR